MKIKLNKPIMLNWPRKDDPEKVTSYQFTENQFSIDLPDEISRYILENYENEIIEVDDSKETKPEVKVEDIVKAVKEKSVSKKKAYEEKKELETRATTSGMRLSDIAKS